MLKNKPFDIDNRPSKSQLYPKLKQ